MMNFQLNHSDQFSLISRVAKGALLSVGLTAMSSVMAIAPGEQAKSFALKDMHGNQVKLEQFSGKTVILEWTNHECPYVKKHYGSGNMQRLQKDYASNDQVVWLSIISSAPGKQGHVDSAKAQQLTKERLAQPDYVLFDPSGEVGRAYSAKTTPHMYIIDQSGKVQYNGAIDSISSADKADVEKATNYLSQAMLAMAEGKPVSSPLTKPYGCSIKY